MLMKRKQIYEEHSAIPENEYISLLRIGLNCKILFIINNIHTFTK